MPPETPTLDSFFKPIEGTTDYFRWDHEAFMRSLSPAARRNIERRNKVWAIQRRIHRACPWMMGPLLGLVTVFWVALAEEGIYQTMKPRWGALTFSYLNDGMKPTVWHTWQQVMHPGGKYDAIWPGGAPRNKAEADKTP